MNFRLVLSLSLLGALVGICSILGLVRAGVESIVWIAIAIVYAVVIARAAPGRHFLHGFLTGFVGCLLAALIQAAFFDQYLAHNPSAAESFRSLPAGMSPRLVVVLMTPVVAAVFGLVSGFLSWAAARLMRPKPAAA